MVISLTEAVEVSLNPTSDKRIRRDFVTRRIPQVGSIGPGKVTTRARLTFISSTGGKAGSMESINLFRGGSSEADSHPVSGRCFTVARTGNDKCRLFAAIEYPAVAKRAEVIDTKRAQTTS